MSSSPLYLAIVAVWAVVLVPMLLRRDASYTTWIPRRAAPTEDRAEARDEGHDEADEEREADVLLDEEPPDETDLGEGPSVAATEPDTVRRRRRPVGRPLRRATVIARRRRRTSGLVLLLLLTAGAVGAGLGPWWVVAPPAVLLIGHLALLRESAKVDAERRAAERRRRARARRAEAERRREEAERKAEVIELASRRRGVYDQYADAQLRAAGD